MDCLKCVGVLKKKIMEHVEIDVCPVCEGIWFDAKELEKIIEADSKDFKFLDVGREEFDGKEVEEFKKELDTKAAQCPYCKEKTLLVKKSFGEGKSIVVVDVCPNGHGVWLDGGEVNALRKNKDNSDEVKNIFTIKAFKIFWNDVKGGFSKFKDRT